MKIEYIKEGMESGTYTDDVGRTHIFIWDNRTGIKHMIAEILVGG